MSKRLERDFDLALLRFGAKVPDPGAGMMRGHRFQTGGHDYFAVRLRRNSAPGERGAAGAKFTLSVDLDTEGSGRKPDDVIGAGAPTQTPLVLRPVFVRREDRMAKLAVRLGLALDTETGDEAFDRTLFVESLSAPAAVRALLAAPAARRALLDLVEAGVERTTIGPAGTRSVRIVLRPGGVPEDRFAEGRFEELLELLGRLAKALPPIERVESRWLAGRVALAAALAVIGGAGVVAKIVEDQRWRRFGPLPATELLGMLAAALSFVLAAWLSARKKPSAVGFFAVTALLGLIAGPLAVSGGVGVWNGARDAAPRLLHTSVDDRWQPSKGLPMIAADTPLGRVRCYTTREEWDHMLPGRPITLEIGDGALGMPWYQPEVVARP